MTRPPLMTTPKEVDGRRLRSLCVKELRSLLDLRVADYHNHLDRFRNDSGSANNFMMISPIVEVLNALQNFDQVRRDGDMRMYGVLTLFMPPIYQDYREASFRDGEGI